jgi:hypothetical protein
MGIPLPFLEMIHNLIICESDLLKIFLDLSDILNFQRDETLNILPKYWQGKMTLEKGYLTVKYYTICS